MKILLLAENWPPRRGGIENYLTHIVEGLADAGHAVTVVVPRTDDEVQAEDIENVTLIRKRFFWPLVRPRWLPFYYWLWRYGRREKIDWILCGKGLFEGLVGYYLSRHLKLRYVVFTYAMEIEVWQRSRNTLRRLKKVLRSAQLVIYINKVTGKVLSNLGVANERLLKIYPGVDERFLAKVEDTAIDEVKERYGLAKDYVLSVGRLIERKGFDVLIEAFAGLDQTRFEDVQLAIVGSGHELENLKNVAKHALILPSVTFLTDVPDKDLPALYAGAKLFALTPLELVNDIEGFGIVYLEAAAQGRPAVATATGGAQEAVVDGETGVVVELNNVKKLRQALTTLLSDYELAARYGEAARNRVRCDFVWRDKIELLVAELKKTTSKRGL